MPRILAAWCALAIVTLAAVPAFAQVTTSNAYIAADVEPASGLINIYLGGSNPKEYLTFIDHSYLTVQVGNDYYTNNEFAPNIVEPSGAIVASTYIGTIGKSRLIPGTDTIETIWQPKGPDGFDIIQDVYPVQGASSGQIVYKWSILNHQGMFIDAQAQFLLDVETGSNSPDYGTDNPPITTRDGYNPDKWQDISDVPYFITSEYDVCAKNFPNILGAGFTVDDFAPVAMNLTQPSTVAIVDWVSLVSGQYLWGYPSNMLGDVMNDADNAILLQWPSQGAGQNVPQEIGRGCFGTPPCTPITYGKLDALLLHVDHVAWVLPGTYVPNHFPVEAIIWNSNNGSTATLDVATQKITSSSTGLPSGPVRVVSPTPIGPNGYSQKHAIRSCGSSITSFDSVINSCNASYATWEDTVVQGVLINCSTEESFDISLYDTAAGVSQPIFGFGVPDCPITVDCQEKDVLPPRHSVPKIIPGDTTHCGNPKAYKMDSVFDDLSTDQGIQSITYTVSPNSGSIVVTGLPATISGCPPMVGPITITQVDTIHAPCITFTFTDCAGNVSDTTICFEKCVPPTIIDSIPPKFRLLNKSDWNVPTDSSCGNKCSTWMVTDTVFDGLQHDVGLDSIKPIENTNMTFTLLGQPLRRGMPRDSFTVCVADSMQDGHIIIQANDTDRNTSFDTITYCTVADTNPPVLNVNPVGSLWTVQVTEAKPWDRGIQQVRLTAVKNCKPIAGSGSVQIDSLDDSTWQIIPKDSCPLEIDFTVVITDSFKTPCFTIQATDCVGNTSGHPPPTYCGTALSDKDCIKIDTMTIAPGVLSVTIADTTKSYDEGIDSIWFSCANNITLDSIGNPDAIWVSNNNYLHALHGQPTGGDHPRFQQVIHFTLSVTDTNSQIGEPCVCINAINGAGNLLCSPPGPVVEWCSSLNQDTAAPKELAIPTCTSLDLVVTDSQAYDRGVYGVWLDSVTNFAPLDDSFPPSGKPVVPLTLQIPDPDSSSYARLNSLDLYGDQSPIASVKAAHTTFSDVWVYKQDLAMNGTGIDTSSKFFVPVYLKGTDSIPLAQKQLTQFQFRFHLTGSPLVSFVGTKPLSSPPGWTIQPAPGAPPLGPPYTISGSGPPLTVAGEALVTLQFSAAPSSDVEEAQIVIDPDSCGADVLYNGGNDTVLSSKDYSVTLPAPSGRLNGGTIILKDSCATIVGDHPHPIFLSLARLVPNPVSNTAVVQYTVPTEAPVTLGLYDELGRNVRTLVMEVQKQGTYQSTLNTNDLPEGTYFLRLASNGAVCSQRIMIAGK
ncbi:MAG TPA: T9SS type A sorting domain-containing protein [Candidatus Kapabacteria bacterium]|nr:T9SS type A sorting domain-containing protein [Candidatus Kapabacteria bacterium]